MIWAYYAFFPLNLPPPSPTAIMPTFFAYVVVAK